MKISTLFFLLIGFTCLVSCSPNENLLDQNGGSLPEFSVKVIDRAANHAIIMWTDADNPFTDDTVFYNVFIDSVKVSTNLTRRVDTIRNIQPMESYSGRVVAFTRKGDTASAPFTIDKLDGMVIFGENYDFLQCYSLYTDYRVWRSYTAPNMVLGSPVVVGDTVFCSMGGNEPSAFSIKTGEKIWGPAPGTSRNSGGESPVYENGTLYVSANDGLAAVNTKDGTLKWKYSPGTYEFFLNPVVGKDFVYSGRNFEIYAIKKDGSFGWKQSLPAQLNKNPTLIGNVIVVGCSNGRVYGISQSTGAILWNRNFSVVYDNFGTDNTDPIVYNNTVIIHSGNYGFYALNPNTGATIWELPGYSGPSVSSPTIGNGILYYYFGYADLLAIDAATGVLKWSKPVGGGAHGNIIYANGRIYVAAGIRVDIRDANTGVSIGYVANQIRNTGRMVIIDKGVVYYSSSSGMLN